MHLCTAEQMRSIDRRTIDAFGVSGFDLMERAGRAVAGFACRMLGDPAGQRVMVVCGKGNNGGDGFVVGRCLLEQGVRVRCLLLADHAAITGDAGAHLALAEQAGVPVEAVTEADLTAMSPEADLVVDAILGTGLKGPARGIALAGIALINRTDAPVLSVDIPSGLTGGVGFPEPSARPAWRCVKADRTVAIGVMKADLALYPGKAWAGQVDIADIGFPPEAITAERLWLSMPTREEMAALMPRRTPDAHKGDCGRVVIVAGSAGMAGAAALTCRAVLRAGAGLAILGTPASLLDVMAVKLTEGMTRALPETPERSVGLAAASAIEELLAWGDVLAIGPGLSRHPDTAALVRQVVTRSPRPMVVDADGLNAFIGHTDLWSACRAEAVLTPHVGELARLIDRPAEEILNDRIGAARHAAQTFGVTLVLKGAGTITASPAGQASVNPTGNPGMATAGAGDVLTGVIAGLLAQGLSAWDAARLGVFLHGLAGDLGALDLGQHSLIAGDLIDRLPAAFLQVGQP